MTVIYIKKRVHFRTHIMTCKQNRDAENLRLNFGGPSWYYILKNDDPTTIFYEDFKKDRQSIKHKSLSIHKLKTSTSGEDTTKYMDNWKNGTLI